MCFEEIAFGIHGWLEAEFGVADDVLVVAIFVGEADTRVKVLKICIQRVERPHVYVFCEQGPKCSVAPLGHPIEIACGLMPLQWTLP